MVGSYEGWSSVQEEVRDYFLFLRNLVLARFAAGEGVDSRSLSTAEALVAAGAGVPAFGSALTVRAATASAFFASVLCIRPMTTDAILPDRKSKAHLGTRLT